MFEAALAGEISYGQNMSVPQFVCPQQSRLQQTVFPVGIPGIYSLENWKIMVFSSLYIGLGNTKWEYMGIRGNTWEYVYSQGFLRQVGIHGRPSGNGLGVSGDFSFEY